MVQFTFNRTEINKSKNEIQIHLEKPPLQEPYIHQAILNLTASDALKLRDQLKIAIEKLTQD